MNFENNVYEINTTKDKYNFTAKDIFVKTAIEILNGKSINSIAKKTKDFKTEKLFKPFVSNNSIIGNISYIDNYGNCISNIDKAFFLKHKNSRDFILKLKRQYITINNFFESYNDIKKNDQHPYCLFNANNFLEVVIFESDPNKNGAANTLLGISENDEIEVVFI